MAKFDQMRKKDVIETAERDNKVSKQQQVRAKSYQIMSK
jgi:hypothetical protein